MRHSPIRPLSFGLPAGVQVFSMLFANPRLLDLVAEIAGSAPRLALGRNRACSML